MGAGRRGIAGSHLGRSIGQLVVKSITQPTNVSGAR
jgi:hypothetical protein